VRTKCVVTSVRSARLPWAYRRAPELTNGCGAPAYGRSEVALRLTPLPTRVWMSLFQRPMGMAHVLEAPRGLMGSARDERGELGGDGGGEGCCCCSLRRAAKKSVCECVYGVRVVGGPHPRLELRQRDGVGVRRRARRAADE